MIRRVDINVHRFPSTLAMQLKNEIPVDMNVHPTKKGSKLLDHPESIQHHLGQNINFLFGHRRGQSA